MPEVAFHFNVPDRLAYSSRLARKALRVAAASGARLAIVGEPSLVDRLDRLLWVADPLDFVPHVRLSPDGPGLEPHLRDTPLWLADTTRQIPDGFSMLLSLADTVPDDAARFERVFEVVSTDPAELGPARQRWRAYQTLGFGITRHDIGAAPAE